MEHFKRDKTFFIQLVLGSVGIFAIFATLISMLIFLDNDFKPEWGTLVLSIGLSIFISFVISTSREKFKHLRVISVFSIFIGIGMMFNERDSYFMNELLSFQNMRIIGIVFLFLYVFNFSYLCFKIEREKEHEKIRPYHNDEGLKLNRD